MEVSYEGSYLGIVYWFNLRDTRIAIGALNGTSYFSSDFGFTGTFLPANGQLVWFELKFESATKYVMSNVRVANADEVNADDVAKLTRYYNSYRAKADQRYANRVNAETFTMSSLFPDVRPLRSRWED